MPIVTLYQLLSPGVAREDQATQYSGNVPEAIHLQNAKLHLISFLCSFVRLLVNSFIRSFSKHITRSLLCSRSSLALGMQWAGSVSAIKVLGSGSRWRQTLPKQRRAWGKHGKGTSGLFPPPPVSLPCATARLWGLGSGFPGQTVTGGEGPIPPPGRKRTVSEEWGVAGCQRSTSIGADDAVEDNQQVCSLYPDYFLPASLSWGPTGAMQG